MNTKKQQIKQAMMRGFEKAATELELREPDGETLTDTGAMMSSVAPKFEEVAGDEVGNKEQLSEDELSSWGEFIPNPKDYDLNVDKGGVMDEISSSMGGASPDYVSSFFDHMGDSLNSEE